MKNCNNGTPIEAVGRAASAASQHQRECDKNREMGQVDYLPKTSLKLWMGWLILVMEAVRVMVMEAARVMVIG